MELNKSEKATERFLFSALSYQENTVLPEFKVQVNRDWVPYGENNLFPDELVNLFNKSGIHNAIIESKTRMMCGDGIVQDAPEEEWSDKTQMFIDMCNPYDSMTEVYKKCAMDYELYGLAYIEVIWGKGRKNIAEIYHLDASKVRWGKRDKGRIKTYYYSEDWNSYRKENYKPIEIPIFDQKATSARQIVPIVRYTPALNYYSFPDYIAGAKWIEIDTEIANFHFNNLKNGMAPSVFFGFPVGETTNEERETIERKIKEKYTGTNQAGKFILAFYDAEGDKKPEVTILDQTNADKQYDLLNRTTLQQILVAHKVVNENLVGISTPGKLGSSEEVLSNYELYFNTVVKPEQQSVLDPFKKIMLVNGYNDIMILENQPINTDFSENIMSQILTQDEMREILGYEPLENVENVIDENEVVEDESGVTVNQNRYTYDFAGVRSIDATNAFRNLPKALLDDKYVWRLRSGDKEACPICKKNEASGSRTLREWFNKGIPGVKSGLNFGKDKNTSFNPGPYSTYCEQDCRCRLVKVK